MKMCAKILGEGVSKTALDSTVRQVLKRGRETGTLKQKSVKVVTHTSRRSEAGSEQNQRE